MSLRFSKSVVLGLAATLVDLASLTVLVEIFRVPDALANVPALLMGATVQFLGCRNLVFQAREAHWGGQLAGFAAVEIGALALNALGFHAFAVWIGLPYAIARLGSTFLVFVLFSYPLWRKVFHRPLARV